MKDQSLVQWFRQMAVLLQCGLPITRSLEICCQQTSDKSLRSASHHMLKELAYGQRLSQAMRGAGAPFEPIHCGAVSVGEMEGDLSLVFLRLSEHSEESARIRRRLLSALAYPTLVILVSAVGLYLLVRFLTPVLSEIGLQLQGEPNLVSRSMLFLGNFFEHELLSLALLVLICLTLRQAWRLLWRRCPKAVERLLFRVPLLGKMLRLSVLIRISQTLETMIAGGLPLTESLHLTAQTCGSVHYSEDVLEPIVERIKRGESLSASLRGSGDLPSSFFGLVVAGEESGRLDQSFRYLTGLYELDLLSSVESFLSALEPLSIATVGLVVLGVLLSVFTPLSKLLTAV